MLRLIAAMWPEGDVGSFLGLHVRSVSLVYGFFAAIIVSVLTIVFALRSIPRRVPTTALLRGVSSSEHDAQASAGRKSTCLRVVLTSIIAIAALSPDCFSTNPKRGAGAFFTAGAAFLTVGLMLLRRRLAADEAASNPDLSVPQLGVRNAARNPTRSMLTAGLLASATFLLVAVESFRRTPEADFTEKSGGSGGFQLIASFDVPLYQDPEDPETGRQEILDALELRGQTPKARRNCSKPVACFRFV